MPSADAVIWKVTAAIIVLMLGIIGYLLNNGFNGLKIQLKTLWDKLDKHQELAESNALKIAQIEARCEERHKQ